MVPDLKQLSFQVNELLLLGLVVVPLVDVVEADKVLGSLASLDEVDVVVCFLHRRIIHYKLYDL